MSTDVMGWSGSLKNTDNNNNRVVVVGDVGCLGRGQGDQHSTPSHDKNNRAPFEHPSGSGGCCGGGGGAIAIAVEAAAATTTTIPTRTTTATTMPTPFQNEDENNYDTLAGHGKLSVATGNIGDLYEEISSLRKEKARQRAELEKSMSYMSDMHKWASKITTSVRKLEEKNASYEAALHSARDEILRLQEKVSKQMNKGVQKKKCIQCSRKKRMRLETDDETICSESSENNV